MITPAFHENLGRLILIWYFAGLKDKQLDSPDPLYQTQLPCLANVPNFAFVPDITNLLYDGAQVVGEQLLPLHHAEQVQLGLNKLFLCLIISFPEMTKMSRAFRMNH